MEFTRPDYHTKKPREEDLWVHKSVGYRLFNVTSIGAIVGAFSSSIACYWYDYPPLKVTDNYRTAAWACAKITGKVAFAFAASSLVYQSTVEITNQYQERRTAAGPFLGGALGCITLGMMTKYTKTGIMMGLVAGAGAAFLGHMPPFPLAMRYRERIYEKSDATEKFRYLKALEHREEREAERLAEIAALREFSD